MMKYIRGLFALILMIGLTACGGGGGSGGSTNTAKLFTTAPAALTIGPGEVQTFSVGGGVPAYAATAANSAVIVTLVDKTLTIKGAGGGTSTVTVTDNAGSSVNISITIGSGLALFTTAPTSVTVGVGAQSSVYTIGGGSLSYKVASSNNAIAAVQFNGNSFIITGVTGGKATVTVADSIGGLVSINVVVGSVDALFSTAAGDVNIGVGVAATYAVGGGNAPYTADSSAIGVATASVVNGKLTITGVSVGTATVVIHDATAGVVPIKVTVGSTADLFTSAPSTLTVGIGTSSPTFTIGGGSQLYTVTSGNTQIATVGVNGNKFTINGVAAGNTTVIVKDSLGKTVSINVVIGSGAALYTTAPGDITLAAGGSGTYVIGGGSAPYTATSSNTAVVTTSVSGNTLVLSGVGSGKAVVILRDAAGATLPINVTLGSGAVNAVFTTAPGAVTIAVGSNPTYQIGGGTAPYTVSSSNTSVATVALSGSNFTITAVATGSANIVVKDATGTPVTIVVSIGSGASVNLYTSAPSTVNIAVSAAPVYTVGGGTAPYTATSSDVKVATVAVSGGSMTITGVGPGTAVVRLVDSVGAPINITVNVISATSNVLIVSPTSITAYANDILSIRVDGGTPPYTAISNNPSVASITNGAILASAGTVTVFLAKPLAEGVIVVISDANGNSQNVNIIVKIQLNTLTLSPTSWTINETNNSTVSLTVSGGSGPFQVFTSDTGLSSVAGTSPDAANPLTFNGRNVNVSLGTLGNRCVAADTPVTITLKDSLGTTATSVMTIKDLNGAAGC